jgi:putative phosphoribosyl transferase
MTNVLRCRHKAHAVIISVGRQTLHGNLMVPEGAQGIVLFAHGSGSSRLSPRNRYVAHELNQAGLATLLFDLLSPEEERVDAMTGELRFNIELLADRLLGARDWVIKNPEIYRLNIGYFGASTGAAASLLAASQNLRHVDAIVSRGGRPDLTGPALHGVKAPTLLIVGSKDDEVIQLNRQAFHQLTCEKEMMLVPGATHLFEEPGTLEVVAKAATHWFVKYLTRN